MPTLPVHIKHAGKTYDVELNTDQAPVAFKNAIYELTGVPVDRMKVMVKGGTLKDDGSWSKIGPKADQTFMVVGAAGPLPKAPEKPTVFLEDMDEDEVTRALSLPPGLKNLGNTCYMNATVQALRAVPELQRALTASAGSVSASLPSALADLYKTMDQTAGGVVPARFLTVLRQAVPQFGEMDRSKSGMPGMMGGFAQQDAEECWTQIVNHVKTVPGLTSANGADGASSSATQTGQIDKKFVDQYMMGIMQRELKCDEAPEEESVVSSEAVLKVECNINISTNFMQSGIMDALDQKIEKRSPTLGRDAMYSQKSRISRLPTYLTVHMVRFAWRRDINKKAKIMRKVKFPTEYDAVDLCTDELKKQLELVSRRLKELERDRAERRKVRKRTRAFADTKGKSADGDVPMAGPTLPSAATAEDEQSAAVQAVDGGALEDESVYRTKELAELEALASKDLLEDIGSSVTGLYDLVAIVTHKGPAADAGHYMAFVKKSVFHPVVLGGDASTSTAPAMDDDDESWYKFDDDKVSEFPVDKLATLDGGGEDSAAYVLLYRSKPLA